MTRCPHCGSTAQVKILDVDFDLEEDEMVYVRRHYKCDCGTYFRGTVVYAECYGGYEMIDKEEHPFENTMGK